MLSIEIKSNIKIGVEDLLQGVSRLETADLELFLFKKVADILHQRKRDTSTEQETKLVEKIKETVLEMPVKERYDELYQKFSDEKISDVEYEELTSLLKIREGKGVERLGSMIELSKLKNISLSEIMEQV